MPDLIQQLLQPQTPAGLRAYRDVNSHRDRARQYFSCVMATGTLYEAIQAGYVIRTLNGHEPTNESLTWLNVAAASFDAELARMAAMALDVILGDRGV